MSPVRSAIALAVRLHSRDGAPDRGESSRERLSAAVAAIGERRPELFGGPSDSDQDGRLLCSPSSPECVLELVLELADGLRPWRPTFCASVRPLETSADIQTRAVRPAGFVREPETHEATRIAPSVDASIVGRSRAAREAAGGLDATDPRQARVAIVGRPGCEPLGALAGMIVESYDAMTERQRQIVRLTKRSETQQQVAKHLDVSRQAVNQSLAAAGWQHLKRAERIAADGLAALAELPPHER